MKLNGIRVTFLTLAIAAAYPAAAQSNEELLKEVRALRDRVIELEKKLQPTPGAPAAAGAATQRQWGMTPEQSQELSRVAVKTEAMEDSRDAAGFKGLKISGYVDPVYIYNRNQNTAGFQLLNAIGDGGFNYDNSFFGMAYLDIQKETDSGSKWRLTLAPNRGVGAGIDSPSIVHEASASIPLTDLQTRLIVGQVPDWSGYEYLPATQNKLITHNLLFDFTLPFTYTGAGLELTRGKWIMKGMLANMNASKNGANETSPVLTYRVDYSRGEYQGFGFAGVHGKAANFSEGMFDSHSGEIVSQPNSRLDLFEVDGYFIRGDWTVQGQVSVGRQKGASITPFEISSTTADGARREFAKQITEDPASGYLRDSSWWGLSGLVAYKFTPRLEGIVRADYLSNEKNGGGLLGYSLADDHNGIGPDPMGNPNVGANRAALSFGLSYLFDMNTTFKAEYRLDRADQAVFAYLKDGSYRKSNQLFGASVVVAF